MGGRRDENISRDDTLDALREFLPDIEEELRTQVEEELREHYDQQLKEQRERLQQQAQSQFEEAMRVLSSEMEELRSEKEGQLMRELQSLKGAAEERQRQRLLAAQERFIQEHFEDRIMSHPMMLDVERQLQQEIGSTMLERIQGVREKKLRQMRVRLQGRELKERGEADRSMKAQIYAKSGLEDLRGDINKFKIYLGSMKSKYNIRISKISHEIKELSRKCRESEFVNGDQVIEDLQREIEDIRKVNQEIEARKAPQTINQNSFSYNHWGYKQPSQTDFREQSGQFRRITQEMSRHRVFDLVEEHSRQRMDDVQYIDEDVQMQSESDDDSLADSRQELPPPPSNNCKILGNLIGEEEQLKYNQKAMERESRPLLQMDVARMLREQWREDSFEKYLANRGNKQNTDNGNGGNFQSLYEVHLRKLNRDSRIPRMKKLSQRSRHQIMSNFTSNRR